MARTVVPWTAKFEVHLKITTLTFLTNDDQTT